ncbi:MAG TPA: DALR domain-containing protein, partial [Gaiellaceae bacterium]|nr:DALR domain-containing protein [Gaiellaceae bacterium]
MLQFTDAKMSKSIGNVVTMREALDRYGPETLLVFFLTGHWRKPIDFSEETLAAAEARAESVREVFRNPSVPAPGAEWERFAAALNDDFNTPEALAIMHGWRDHELLRRALNIFGLGSLADVSEDVPADVIDLAQRRKAARADGDYAEADRLRGEVERAGWELRDVGEEPGYRLVRRR